MFMSQGSLQLEQMQRWAQRMNKSLAAFEEPVALRDVHDIVPYFAQLEGTVHKFVSHIQSAMAQGKVQKKTMQQAASKEAHEQVGYKI